MLRVKVQSCKWECLLCSRTFSTKFCYALHCKNVHGKRHEDSVIDASCIIDNRPSQSLTDIENHSDGSNTGSTEHTSVDGKLILSAKENGKEGYQDGFANFMACQVCRKTFSNGERLNSHKTLHTIPALKRSTRSYGGKALKGKRKRTAISKPNPQRDESISQSIKSEHEQKGEIEKENYLEDSQPKNLKIQNLITDDHFYATNVPESNASQNLASIISQNAVQLLNTTDRDDAENNGKSVENTPQSKSSENTILHVENAAVPIAVAYPKKRGRPRKDQALAVIMPKAGTDEDQDTKQSIVFSCSTDMEKEAKKSGPRKKTRECDVCHKIFANRSSLREHRRIHTGEKPFICAVCDKGFIRMGHLKQHMCSHTGLWPFKCGACGKGFMNPSRVTRHMRVHNDERPNVCDQCGESFKEPHHLARHMHLHSGLKPYKCPICEDRYFIQSGNLKIHMKTHEEEMKDSNVALDDISHEITASTSQLGEENASSATTREVALDGIITVSEGDVHMIESASKNSAFITESNNTDRIESSKADDVTTVNEIVLQIVPGAEHNVQVHGLQGLASIDQELLRQFATSVAHELAQSEQAT